MRDSRTYTTNRQLQTEEIQAAASITSSKCTNTSGWEESKGGLMTCPRILCQYEYQ